MAPTSDPLGAFGALVAVPNLRTDFADMKVQSHVTRFSNGKSYARIDFATSGVSAHSLAVLSALADSLGTAIWKDERYRTSGKIIKRHVAIDDALFSDGRTGVFQGTVANRVSGSHISLGFTWDTDQGPPSPVEHWPTVNAPMPAGGTPHHADSFAYYVEAGHRLVEFRHIDAYDVTTASVNTAIATAVAASVYDLHDTANESGLLGYFGRHVGRIRPFEIPDGRIGIELSAFGDAWNRPRML